MMKTILHNLKNFREARHLSQEYLAAELGISQAAYSKIENGKTELTIAMLDKICHILHVNRQEMMTESNMKIEKTQDFMNHKIVES
ncbi:MAG: helix-turn-helix transcriptional regulator [Saprospiraceae bacterium]|nr:helix-turn-helix transcriptional regulator [Saprospiraceae bacterium]